MQGEVRYYQHSFVSGQYFATQGLYIRFPPHKVHGVDVYILFLETALVSTCISPKQYSMEISNLQKVLILPGVSGNMSMLYDRLVCINQQICDVGFRGVRLRHVPLCIRFPPLKVHGVDVYILFLETALVSMCISLKSYSMEIHYFF